MVGSLAARARGCALGLSLLFWLQAGVAQKPETALTPQAQEVLHRLAVIADGIPDAGWRTHPGDLPHGEAPDLDDSHWEFHKGSFREPPPAVWFRQTITIPERIGGYPTRGAKLYMDFHCPSDGTAPSILYVNGRRIAQGDDLEPTLLTDNAQPGDVMKIAVKVLRTRSDKRKGASQFTFVWPAGQPSPSDLYVELEAAATLLPTLFQDPAQLQKQLSVVSRAAERVNLKALDGGPSDAFTASVREAQVTLEPVRPLLKQLTVDLIGHAHIDTEWLWPLSETQDVVHRTFFTALQLMEEYPDYKYTQSVAQYSAWMQEKYPDIFADMLARTKEGRWEPVGGMWVEPDLNMPDGESIVRQLLLGTEFFRTQMGATTDIGWNPDSFGYNWQLPQIYSKSGYHYFVTQKMDWNPVNKLPLKLFWWQAPDGSRVLTYFPHGYTLGPDPLMLANDFATARKRAPGEPDMLHIYGVGDHGGGPTRIMLDLGDHWKDAAKIYPQVRFTTAKDFFADVAPRVDIAAGTPVWNYRAFAAGPLTLPQPEPGRINVPVWNDELYLEIHRGCYTTQSEHKKHLRDEEERLLNTEKLASLAWLGGAAYPASPLNDAWKKTLVAEFHDTLGGSGVASVYKDEDRSYESIRQTTDEVTRQSLDTIASHIDTRVVAGGVPLLVFNPLGWKRSGVVEAAVQLAVPAKDGVEVLAPGGHPVLSQTVSTDGSTGKVRLLLRADDVPSIGYTVLQVKAGSRVLHSSLHVSADTLENDLLRARIDPQTGCITELVDKSTGFNAIAAGGCGNELQSFVDTPKNFDAWDFDADALEKMTPIHQVDAIEVVERGPVRASVRITRHWGQSTFVQTLRLVEGAAQLDVDNDIDWHETHVLLKAAVPLSASGPQATYEIPYGSIQRPTTRNNPIERAKYEVPALRWADLGDSTHGLSLLNASKYGYDAAGNVLRLSLLRAPVYPDPTADRGRHQFVYSLYPHSGTWQKAMTVRRGYELNYPLQAYPVASHQGSLPAQRSFVDVDGDNVVLTAVKKADESDAVVLRLYEWAGTASEAQIALPAHALSAAEVSMMENVKTGETTLSGNTVRVSMKPFEIKTIRVEYAPGTDIWSARP